MEMQNARIMGVAHCLVPKQMPIDRPILLQPPSTIPIVQPTVIQTPVSAIHPNPVMQPPPSIVQVIVPIAAAPLLPAPQALIQPDTPIPSTDIKYSSSPIASVPLIHQLPIIPRVELPVEQPVTSDIPISQTHVLTSTQNIIPKESILTTTEAPVTTTEEQATFEKSKLLTLLSTDTAQLQIISNPRTEILYDQPPVIQEKNNIESENEDISTNTTAEIKNTALNDTETVITVSEAAADETATTAIQLESNDSSITERVYSVESTEIAEDPPEALRNVEELQNE